MVRSLIASLNEDSASGAIRSLVSPIGGLVSHVRAYELADSARQVRLASAGHGRHPEQSPELVGVGVGLDESMATGDAICRAALLYAAAGWDAPAMRWASADELGDDAIVVEDLARVSPIETRDRIRWVEGFAIDDGRPTWVPAVLAYVGLGVAVEAEGFWAASLAGLGAGDDLGAAVVHGLLDVVARDALAVARTRGARLALLAREGEGVAIFDATSDLGIPAAIAQGPASFEVGIGAAATIGVARATALDDLIRRRARRTLKLHPEEAPPDPGFEPINEGIPLPPSAEPSIDLSKPALVSRLRGLGLAAFAVDLTTDELRRVGMTAVRIVAPGLSPIPPVVGWTDHARLDRVAP